jgi:hypothetical protein
MIMLTDIQKELHTRIVNFFLEQGMVVSVATEGGITEVTDTRTDKPLFNFTNGMFQEALEQWCHTAYHEFGIIPF